MSEGGDSLGGNEVFFGWFFDFVVFFANWCFSQDLAQDREAATWCLTAKPVRRGFAQYGQRWDIFGDVWNSESRLILTSEFAATACYGGEVKKKKKTLLLLLWSMPPGPELQLGPMPHSFPSTIRPQTADALFTRPTRFNVWVAGVYKCVIFYPISPQAPVLTTFKALDRYFLQFSHYSLCLPV